jgi:hypothetical protein
MDSLITAAARALAASDPLGALNRVTLRDDATALALRGIAMARVALRVFTGEEGSAPLDLAKPDQDRRALLRQLETSFSKGAEWKALISKYIGTIPL